MAIILWLDIQDAKGLSSRVSLPFAGDESLDNIITAAPTWAELVQAVSDGGLKNAGITIELDLSDAWDSVASANSDIQEKARFSFRTASNFAKSLSFPTFKETLFNSGSKLVNSAAPAVAALITAVTDGFGALGFEVYPTDIREDDIDNFETACEMWGRYNSKAL